MATVLIVEDNAAVYYSLQFLLKNEGYQTLIATDIKASEVLLHEEDIDMVLLDYNLPDGRGDKLLHHMRQEMQSDIPVIVMSATSKAEMVHKMLEMGANHYLHKPFDMREFLDLIEYWTGLYVAD